MVDNSKLDQFLRLTKSPSPVNAIVYNGEPGQLEELQTSLAHNGYHEVHEIKDLLARLSLDTRLALYTKNIQAREIAGLLGGIDGKMVEVFDRKTRQKYDVDNVKASVVFIFEKEQIKELQKQGFKLLENVGIVFQF